MIRRGGRIHGRKKSGTKVRLSPLGNRTWLVGVHELVREPAPFKQEMIAKATSVLRPKLRNHDEEPDWVEWTGDGQFVRNCKAGDSLIMIWRNRRSEKPKTILRPRPVLLKLKRKGVTHFYLAPEVRPAAEMSVSKFTRLLRSLGHTRRIGPHVEQLLDEDMATAISRRWVSVVKGKSK